jgi:hypothetical protein
MATQKLIQLFEDVLKVNEEGSHTKLQCILPKERNSLPPFRNIKISNSQ